MEETEGEIAVRVGYREGTNVVDIGREQASKEGPGVVEPDIDLDKEAKAVSDCPDGVVTSKLADSELPPRENIVKPERGMGKVINIE